MRHTPDHYNKNTNQDALRADKQPKQCFSVGHEPPNDGPLTLDLFQITATFQLLCNESQSHPGHKSQISH